MDPARNPPGLSAGSRISGLTERESILVAARIACGRALLGKSARSMMVLGSRGTGKTVLLNEMGRIAQDEGLLVSRVGFPDRQGLARLLYPEILKVMRSLSGIKGSTQIATHGLRALRGFAATFQIDVADVDAEVGVEPEVGLVDSGDLQYDLPDLFELVGGAAKAAGTGWVLLIDEVQDLSEQDLSALIVTIHRVSQERFPVVLVGAGLPEIVRLAGEAKSYAERLFRYYDLDAFDKLSAT